VTSTLLRQTPPPRPDQQWWEDGLCKDHPDPDIWTYHSKKVTDGNREAAAICRKCPSRIPCFLWGVETRSTGQIYGGLRMPSDVTDWSSYRMRRSAYRLRRLADHLKAGGR
jgi:hypothetical protein